VRKTCSLAGSAERVVEECDPDVSDKIAEASSETLKEEMTGSNPSKANEAWQPSLDQLNSASLSTLSDAIHSAFRVFEILRELPYSEVIRFARRAQEWLKVHEQQIEAMEELQQRLDRTLSDIRDLPWLEYPAILQQQLVADEALTIDKRIGELERLYCCLVEIHEAHLRLSAIVERLGEIPSPFISRDTVQLESLLDLMKSRISEYSVRAAELDKREQQIGEFVGQVQSSDIDMGLRMVQDATASVWIDIIRFVLSSSPRTERGLAFKHLVGRLELAAVACARVCTLDPATGPSLLANCIDVASSEQETLLVLLGFLNIEQLSLLAETAPRLLPGIAQALFAASILGDQSGFHYVEPFCASPALPHCCVRLYHQVIQLWRQNELSAYNLGQMCSDLSDGLTEGPEDLIAAIKEVRREADLGNKHAVSLTKTLLELNTKTHSELVAFRDFANRCYPSVEGTVVLRDPTPSINPFMLRSWPLMAAKRPIELLDLLYDSLLPTTTLQDKAQATVVRYYLDRKLFLDAQKASDYFGSTELNELVATEFRNALIEIQTEYGGLVADAKTIQDDKEINELLTLYEASVNRLDVIEARNWLKELTSARDTYKLRCDPRRRDLITFLKEGGASEVDESSIDKLEKEAEKLRDANAERRVHVYMLSEAANDKELPISVRGAWSGVASTIDRPGAWPKLSEESYNLGVTLEILKKFIARRWVLREIDPRSGSLAEAIGNWTAERLIAGLSKVDSKALNSLHEMSIEIQGLCHDLIVWQRLDLAPPIHPHAVQPSTVTSPREQQKVGEVTIPGAGRKVSSEAIRAEIRAGIQQFLEQEPVSRYSVDGKRQLRGAAKNDEWSVARLVATSLLREPGGDWRQDRLTDEAVVYMLALAHSADLPRDQLAGVLGLACLATAHRPSQALQYYVNRDILNSLPSRWILALVGEREKEATSESLGRSIAKLMDPSYEQQKRVFADIMWKASQVVRSDDLTGSDWLAEQLWEAMPGRDATGRSELFLLLFSIRRQEALSHLAGKIREPLDDLIRSYVRVFIRAENDQLAIADAVQAAVNFEERSGSQPNTKPWKRLFKRLSGSHVRSVGPQVAIYLESDILDHPKEGQYVLHLRVVPSYADPPRSLSIEIGGEGRPETRKQLVNDDAPLVDEKVISVEIDASSIGSSDDYVHLAYHILGQTIDLRAIDIRDEWVVPNPVIVSTPIPHTTIERNWPGASGAEVRRNYGFYGRNREIRIIESMIAGDRPRSMMVHGQRRIGKTSLLWQLLDSFPPSQGRVVTAYCTMTLPNLSKESLPRVFFDTILSALETNPKNDPLRQCIRREGHDPSSLSELPKKARPEVSIGDALEYLAQRLNVVTGGQVERLVLLIDEFDRFVEPLMLGRKVDVEGLMWGLRPVVMASPRIGLVLAGSGLQRVFVDGYDQAFFGSIQWINLSPFNWEDEQDRNASQETFLPTGLRDRLCSGQKFEEVSSYAHQLCGGIPYYLSMLGASAAAASKGHKFTRTALDRVVSRILFGEFKTVEGSRSVGVGLSIDPKLFYMPIFDALNALSVRQSLISQVLLTRVSVRTTQDYPWLRRQEVIEGPEIASVTEEIERFDAVKRLVDLEALEAHPEDPTRVRIRVPLTRSALASHATMIIEEARIQFRKGQRER